MLCTPLDESPERFDVRDVLSAEHRKPRAQVLVESHAVRGEPVPQLTSETSAPHVPVRQDDRLAVVGRNRLAQPEHGGALVDHTNVSGHRSEEHTSELQSLAYLVCRLLLEKKK